MNRNIKRKENKKTITSLIAISDVYIRGMFRAELASNSSSPVDIFSTSGRQSVVALDMLCNDSSRSDTSSGVTAAATSKDCRSELNSPAAGYCRSPDASSVIAPGDFVQSMSGTSSAAVEAAALRLMLGGRNHLGHHQLPVLGVGPSSMALGGQASIGHRQHPMDSSAFYLPPVSNQVCLHRQYSSRPRSQ